MSETPPKFNWLERPNRIRRGRGVLADKNGIIERKRKFVKQTEINNLNADMMRSLKGHAGYMGRWRRFWARMKAAYIAGYREARYKGERR